MLYQVCNQKKKTTTSDTLHQFFPWMSHLTFSEKVLPSKLLIPLTCWVFSKVSSEEDRTLRLKRPSQGPSLVAHEPSSEPQKKNRPSRKLAYPTLGSSENHRLKMPWLWGICDRSLEGKKPYEFALYWLLKIEFLYTIYPKQPRFFLLLITSGEKFEYSKASRFSQGRLPEKRGIPKPYNDVLYISIWKLDLVWFFLR